MVNHLRTIGISVQGPQLRTMPDQAGVSIADKPVVIVVNFWFKWLGPHYTPLKMTQQFVPPNPNALESAISYFTLRAVFGTTSTSASLGSGR